MNQRESVSLTGRIIGQSTFLKLLTNLSDLRDDSFDLGRVMKSVQDERQLSVSQGGTLRYLQFVLGWHVNPFSWIWSQISL